MKRCRTRRCCMRRCRTRRCCSVPSCHTRRCCMRRCCSSLNCRKAQRSASALSCGKVPHRTSISDFRGAAIGCRSLLRCSSGDPIRSSSPVLNDGIEVFILSGIFITAPARRPAHHASAVAGLLTTAGSSISSVARMAYNPISFRS